MSAVKAFAGTSVYAMPPQIGFDLESPNVEAQRRALGGQLQPMQTSQLEWFLSDLETAQRLADVGDVSWIARLARTMRRDGYINGLLETRTAGLVALPKRFHGDANIVGELQETAATRPLFDEMFPAEALGPFLGDLLVCGVAVAELLPVVGRDYPVMVRRDPEFLRYRWNEDRWYFNTVAGPVPITPGDGRWMLALGDRISPWNTGYWAALGRAYIIKEHAMLARANFARKLANPAIIGYSPPAATEVEQTSWLNKLVAWGLNTVFQAPQGWDVKLLETNGRGWEVFTADIEASNLEITITLAGSTVMVDGGTGFANAGIHAGVRADLIKKSAAALEHCINTQGLPPWVIKAHGADALKKTPRVEWDVAPAADRETEAKGLEAIAKAITALKSALSGDPTVEHALNTAALLTRYGVPLDPKTEAPEPEPMPVAGAPGAFGAKPGAPQPAGKPGAEPPKAPPKESDE